MAHMMKFTKASCGHMFAHFDRRAENISNENLDRTKTHLNYNLATHQQMSQGEFVKQRCSEVRCQNRKDVNVMASWVITAPTDLAEAEQKDFFRSSYNFLQNRYGKENVISAYVHMDEVTPHMHFAFVPIAEDKKRGGYKLSAKEVITRKDLQTFHTDLSNHVEKTLGHEVGILNDATRDGNRSIKELKRKSATERLQEVNKKAAKIVSKAENDVLPIRAEYESKMAYIDDIKQNNVVKSRDVKVKKSIRGKETVTIAASDYEELVNASREYGRITKARNDYQNELTRFSTEHFDELNQELEQAHHEIDILTRENKKLSSELMWANINLRDAEKLLQENDLIHTRKEKNQIAR